MTHSRDDSGRRAICFAESRLTRDAISQRGSVQHERARQAGPRGPLHFDEESETRGQECSDEPSLLTLTARSSCPEAGLRRARASFQPVRRPS